MIKTLLIVANEKATEAIINERGSYVDHPLYGDKPLFVSWDSIVEGVMGSITLSAAPRPTVQDRLDEMRRSEVNYVIYVVEKSSRYFVPVGLLTTADFFVQVFEDGRQVVLNKSEPQSST